jgi:hypothetical protein
MGIFLATLFVHMMLVIYRNGLFSGNDCPRAIVSCLPEEPEPEESETEEPEPKGNGVICDRITVRLILPKPVKVKAGQYINLWLPSVGLWSWAQTHPFMVTSWSDEKQPVLDLLIEPRRGLSAAIHRQARAAGHGSLSFLALYSGPHGISESVSQYERVLMVATGSGIATVIPYVRMLIHGYNTCTSYVRWIHLIWQVDNLGKLFRLINKIGSSDITDFAISGTGQLNALLRSDVLDNGYVSIARAFVIFFFQCITQILNICMYISHRFPIHEKLRLGRHGKVSLYEGAPDYATIISDEALGKAIENPSAVRDKKDKSLLMGKLKN